MVGLWVATAVLPSAFGINTLLLGSLDTSVRCKGLTNGVTMFEDRVAATPASCSISFEGGRYACHRSQHVGSSLTTKGSLLGSFLERFRTNFGAKKGP